jgi:peptidoglycan L-alanyl-D-glutamate endopeptidase CwlK
MTLEQLRADVRYWQRLLRAEGLYAGAIDGIRGPKQRAAEAEWQRRAEAHRAALGSFDARSEANMATLTPSAQRVARQWLSKARVEAEKLGVVVRIICGTRSYAEQEALYAQGRTKAGARVTNARGGYSWHNFGLAWDFGIFSRDGSYLGESPAYRVLGSLAYGVPGAEWGGEWKSFPDLPHIQLRKYGSIAEARGTF